MSSDNTVGVTAHNIITYYFCVVCNLMRTPLKYNSDFIKYSTLIGLCTENSLKQEIIVYIGINYDYERHC